MRFPASVRRAIHDRAYPRRSVMKPGTVTVSVTVRMTIDRRRIGTREGRSHVILTDREMTCLQPTPTTLFGSLSTRRIVELIVNRRRVELVSISSNGGMVFESREPRPKKERRLL